MPETRIRLKTDADGIIHCDIIEGRRETIEKKRFQGSWIRDGKVAMWVII